MKLEFVNIDIKLIPSGRVTLERWIYNFVDDEGYEYHAEVDSERVRKHGQVLVKAEAFRRCAGLMLERRERRQHENRS